MSTWTPEDESRYMNACQLQIDCFTESYNHDEVILVYTICCVFHSMYVYFYMHLAFIATSAVIMQLKFNTVPILLLAEAECCSFWQHIDFGDRPSTVGHMFKPHVVKHPSTRH